MITMLVQLTVVMLVFGVFWWVLQQIPLPPIMRTVLTVVVALIGCLFLLSFFGVLDGAPGGFHMRGWR